MIITIDGPAGTGKTTVARTLSEELGFTYLDTGAMYRTLTYGIQTQGVNYENAQDLEKFLNENPVRIESRLGVKHYFLGSVDVTDKIRTNEVDSLVSKISSYRSVREKLVATQQEIAKGVNAVVEGRDMGTVVFPNAQLKIFLTARPEVRAKRRYLELIQKDPNISEQNVLDEINKRDTLDSHRDISPMRPADDADIIDTSDLSIDDVVNRIIVLKEKLETQKP